MAMVTLSFDAARYQLMLDDQLTKDEFINELLKGKAQHLNAICEHLRTNHAAEGGSPDVTNFDITAVEYNITKTTGKVYLKYEVHYVWGCSGINNAQWSKETCPFSIDPASLTLALTIPDTPVRDTYEEF